MYGRKNVPDFGVECIEQDFEFEQAFGQDELGMSAGEEEDEEWEFGGGGRGEEGCERVGLLQGVSVHAKGRERTM